MDPIAVKKSIGRLIPYPLIENGRKVLHAGLKKCPVCENRIREYLDSGYGFSVLERLQVVGGLRRFADGCPICHSTSRERLIWMWLSNGGKGFRLEGNPTIAHFAPEKGLTRRLQDAAGGNYQAYDFDPSRYRHLHGVEQADLSDLHIAPVSVDLLLCNHVLEHVPDVPLALRNIYSVLKPGAVAILQVPIAMRLDSTIELGMDSTPAERIAKCGQDDHVRLFTMSDYLSALEKAGFAVDQYRAFDDDENLATEWRLDPFEVLLCCRKPAA